MTAIKLSDLEHGSVSRFGEPTRFAEPAVPCAASADLTRHQGGWQAACWRRPRSTSTLVGRDRDLEVIRAFVDEAPARGQALLLSGDPGVGKSALLDAAEELADAAGTRVLRAAGAPFEDMSFFRTQPAPASSAHRYRSTRLSAAKRAERRPGLGRRADL